MITELKNRRLTKFDEVDENSIFLGKFHKVGEFISLLHNAITAA